MFVCPQERKASWPALLLVMSVVLVNISAALAETRLEVTEVAPGVFVSTGSHSEVDSTNLGAVSNAGFVVGDSGVAVIDTGGSHAVGQALRAAVRRVTDRPVTYVINTHVHPDHVFGNGAFAATGAEFLGHYKLSRAIEQRMPFYANNFKRLIGIGFEGSTATPPAITVKHHLDIDLGGRTLRLTAHPTAHTDADLTVLDVITGTLFAGDLLFVDRLPVIDGSLKGWLAVVEKLRAVDATRAVPGHGPASVPWPEAADAQQRYLTRLLEGVRAVLAAGGTLDDAMAKIGQDERARWRLFDRDHARNVTASFTELEWE
ncbi:MAG: quinoprotein relay system zinc metallohydrolase 2 [Gammaproteobacteria bacterium]|nr:quinoprotein relay system zinc metallohydrolase 2 [Gammaproteobacteria bacterium]